MIISGNPLYATDKAGGDMVEKCLCMQLNKQPLKCSLENQKWLFCCVAPKNHLKQPTLGSCAPDSPVLLAVLFYGGYSNCVCEFKACECTLK